MTNLRVVHKERGGTGSLEGLSLDKATFKNVLKENIVLITRALRHQFVIPDFQDFTGYIEEFYWKCKQNTSGQVATYIPQLAKYSPDFWGVSICTVDGQRYSLGLSIYSNDDSIISSKMFHIIQMGISRIKFNR